jgi:beta-galactosidase
MAATREVRLGASWYPDEIGREAWPRDIELMREAGLSVARLAEYAWVRLEPAPGAFDFEWLDEALDLLAGAGIEAILGTPTGAPPAWLMARDPSTQRVAIDGRRVKFGSESRWCPTSPELQAATVSVVEALAEHFGGDPRVVAWQIDNELGCDGDCYCERCEQAFRSWLAERYGSLAELNARWGTAYRGETFGAWEEIPLPDSTLSWLNPSLELDARRFHSDCQVRFLALQEEILRRRCPGQLVTTNLMPPRLYGGMDYQALAEHLDVVGWDDYPTLDASRRWSSPAWEASLVRGMRGTPFWCLEQQVGAVGLQTMDSPHPSEPRLWVWQALAHGATAVLFWAWRTPRSGGAQHWLGVIDADGRAGRRHARIAALAQELRELGPTLEGLEPRADVAVVHDYDSRFAVATQPTNDALDYVEVVQCHYEALRRSGLGVDVVAPGRDLTPYRLVVVANLYLMDEARAAWLREFVDGGGTLVIAPRSGARDLWNATPTRPQPAWLNELAGVEVAEVASFPADRPARFTGAVDGEMAGLYEVLEPKGAATVATYADGPFAGEPAITRAGHVWYFGGCAPQDTLTEFYATVAREASLDSMTLPDGVEAVRATNARGEELLLLLNHAGEERDVELDEPVVLAPYDVALLPVTSRVSDASA